MPSERVRTTTAEKPGRARAAAGRRSGGARGARRPTLQQTCQPQSVSGRAWEATNASRGGKKRPASGQLALGSMEMGMEKYRRARELIAKAGGGTSWGRSPSHWLPARRPCSASASLRATGNSCSISGPGHRRLRGLRPRRRRLRRGRASPGRDRPHARRAPIRARPALHPDRHLGDGSHDCLDTGHPTRTARHRWSSSPPSSRIR